MKITKKKISAFIAVVTVLTMMVGVMAYFTDRVDVVASAKTASADEIIKVTPDPEDFPNGGDEQEILEGKWEENNPDKIVEPGDEVNLSYDLKNIGDGDIDVKETIILTSSEKLNKTSPEWRLFTAVTPDANGAIDGNADAIVTVEAISDYQVKYTIAGFKLAKGETVKKNYHLVFNKWATNAFQGDTCTVDYLVEMRQHVDAPTAIDPNEGWDAIRTAQISFAGQSQYKVVPAA